MQNPGGVVGTEVREASPISVTSAAQGVIQSRRAERRQSEVNCIICNRQVVFILKAFLESSDNLFSVVP